MRLMADSDKPRPLRPPNDSYYQLPYVFSNWLKIPGQLVMVPVKRLIHALRRAFGPKALLLLGLAYITQRLSMLDWLPLAAGLSTITRLSIEYGRYLVIAHYAKKTLTVLLGWHQPLLFHIKIKWRVK